MKSVNRVYLKGTIGQDARITQAGSGRVANISVATEFLWVDKEGNKQKDTDWHNVVAWEMFGIADFSRLVKGTKVSIVGRLRTRKYTDRSGAERYVTEVVADELDVIDEQPRPQGRVSSQQQARSGGDNEEF